MFRYFIKFLGNIYNAQGEKENIFDFANIFYKKNVFSLGKTEN